MGQPRRGKGFGVREEEGHESRPWFIPLSSLFRPLRDRLGEHWYRYCKEREKERASAPTFRLSHITRILPGDSPSSRKPHLKLPTSPRPLRESALPLPSPLPCSPSILPRRLLQRSSCIYHCQEKPSKRCTLANASSIFAPTTSTGPPEPPVSQL
jgi:hypothetical protein